MLAFLARLSRPAIDLGITAGSFLAAYYLASWGFPIPLSKGTPSLDGYLVMIPVVVAAVWVVGLLARLYRPRPAGHYRRLLLDVLVVNVQAALLVLAYTFYLRDFDYSRQILTCFFALNTAAMGLHHGISMARSRFLHSRGIGCRSCLIVGTGDLARDLDQALRLHPWAGLSVVGFIDENDPEIAQPPVPQVDGGRVVGGVEDLGRIVDEHEIQEVLVALPPGKCHRLPEIDEILSRANALFSWALDLRTIRGTNGRVIDLDGLSLLTFPNEPTGSHPTFGLARAAS